MHEMAFAEEVLAHAVRAAEQHGGARVTRVRLRAGDALAIEPASLRFCIEALSAGTLLDGARVEIFETASEFRCPQCGPLAGVRAGQACPRCGSLVRFAADTELILEEIELYANDHN